MRSAAESVPCSSADSARELAQRLIGPEERLRLGQADRSQIGKTSADECGRLLRAGPVVADDGDRPRTRIRRAVMADRVGVLARLTARSMMHSSDGRGDQQRSRNVGRAELSVGQPGPAGW